MKQRKSSTLALLTDFGLDDTYVAEVKAVLLGAGPHLRWVDITHSVAPYDVEGGGFQLLRSHSHFPKGTCFLGVVDPGVGSHRRAVWVRTRDYDFVGPDNGLLKWAVEACHGNKEIREIPIPPGTLPTFHGRDVFAPFVVGLAQGKPGKTTKLESLVGDSLPRPKAEGSGWNGEILAVDRYGNLVTNLPLGMAIQNAQIGRARFTRAAHYAAIPAGRAALIQGSHGFWEVSCRNASAAKHLGAARGDRIRAS